MKAKFKIGDKVCMKDDVAHIALPEFYPDCTVIGEAVMTARDKKSGNHTWLVEKSRIVKVEE